ncbi:MAG: flp pilus assembly protein [Bryobacterales bacterium]|nr:flp pilus assembly protein [Bryobacterales bacterium]
MWTPIFAFAAAFLLIVTAGVLIFYRGSAYRRLSQIVVSPSQAALLTGITGITPVARIEKLLQPFQGVVPRSAKEVSNLRKMLAQAGYREARHVNTYYAAKVLAPAGLCLLATFSGSLPLTPLFVYATAAGLGFLVPDFWLGRLISARKLNIRLGLPEALDLLVVCVEAGLSLDKSILRTSEEMRVSQPAIADELSLISLEQRAGRPRADAWNECAERTGVDTVRALASLIIQADKFGTSVGKALRAQADSLRTRRRQNAEEQAAKTTVKLVFPLVLLIFPSLFVVTLGPSMIVMFEAFQKYFV